MTGSNLPPRSTRIAAIAAVVVWIFLTAAVVAAADAAVDAAHVAGVDASVDESVVASSGGGSQRPQVALVLGGGAARGYSHAGILMAFEDEGIPVDMLVGTSMGSVIAGLYASGYSGENLRHLFDRVELTEYFTPIIPPRGGLLDSRRLEILLHRLTDGATFDDLVIPFYSVVTELNSGEEVALHHGSVARAIIASTAIPGMFPPIEIDGRHFVDGGLKNAVPVNVAHALGADVVIAVDVKKSVEEIDYNNILTNMQLTLWYMIEGYVAQHLATADIVIEPPVDYDSYMDYARVPFFVAQGYEAAMAQVPEIRRILREKDPGFRFGQTPPRHGLSVETLDARIRQATVEARLGGEGYGVSLRPSFHPELRVGADVSYRFAGAGRPQIVRWDAAYGGARAPSFLGVGWEYGDCRYQGCTAVGLRHYRGEPGLVPRLSLRRPLTRHSSASLQWEGATPTSPSPWRARLEGRWSSAIVTEQVYGVEAGREVVRNVVHDAGGLTGPPALEPYVAVDASWRVPFLPNGLTVGELAIVYPALTFGAGVRRVDTGETAWWERTLRAGIGIETRLFGLYPTRSRLEFSVNPEHGEWFVVLLLVE